MISNFLIDFYSEKVGEQLSQDKFNNIINTYGDDYDSLINDLYSKYDPGNINDDKLSIIKDTYGIMEKQPPEEEKQKIEFNKDYDYSDLKETKAKRFDKGIFKMAEREAFDKYKETGEIDVNLLPQEELEEESSKYSKDVSLGVKMLNEFIEYKINYQNALDNIPIKIRNVFDSSQGFAVKFLENFEKGAGDFLVTDSEIFEKPITFKDPETNELIDFKTNPQRFKELNKLNSTGNTRNTIESFYGDTGIKVGDPTKKYIISQFKQVEERSKKLKQTGSITEGGKKLSQGDIDGISDLFGGGVNAVSSVVETVVLVAIATLIIQKYLN